MKEDELTKALVERYRQKKTKEHDHEELNSAEYEINIEAHYNHYGDRGVADLYLIETWPSSGGHSHTDGHLFEIKSASAIERSTGANEILRQYHRMKKYFFEDNSWERPDSLSVELLFTPERDCYEHILDNYELYLSTYETRVPGFETASRFDYNELVCIRYPDPDDITPMVFSERIEERFDGDYEKHSLRQNPDIHEALF